MPSIYANRPTRVSHERGTSERDTTQRDLTERDTTERDPTNATRRTGLLLALGTACISGVAFFLSSYGVNAFGDASTYRPPRTWSRRWC